MPETYSIKFLSSLSFIDFTKAPQKPTQVLDGSRGLPGFHPGISVGMRVYLQESVAPRATGHCRRQKGDDPPLKGSGKRNPAGAQIKRIRESGWGRARERSPGEEPRSVVQVRNRRRAKGWEQAGKRSTTDWPVHLQKRQHLFLKLIISEHGALLSLILSQKIDSIGFYYYRWPQKWVGLGTVNIHIPLICLW